MLIASGLCACTLVSCAPDAPPPAPPPPREVEVVQVAPVDLPVKFEFVGRAASSQRVEIRARVAGFLEKIAYEEGSSVEQGDVLFQMDDEPFEAQVRATRAELAQQQARLDTAEALLRRIEPLAKAQAVAQKELDDAQGQVRAAAAAVEEASARVYQAELDLGYTTIRSPVAGVTGAATQREGAYVNISTAPLTYVARIDPIWVEFSISESQMLRERESEQSGEVRLPKEGTFEVELVLGDGSVHPYRGHISFADATLSETTGTLLVRAEAPNPEGTMHPGQYARVLLHGATRPGKLAVPLRAVRQSPRGAFVWIVDDESKAEQRPVMLGPWSDSGWVIEQGLRAGDRVVVDGSTGLRPGTPLSVVGIARFEVTSGDAPR
jgi:membrane fusion protein (multidrug efflux system)